MFSKPVFNMRGMGIGSRGNVAVLLAALGVFGTGSGWPDIVVAVIMAGLALQGSWLVTRQALVELREARAEAAE